MSYLKELKIGGVTLPHNIILAPMAGVSDLPFRILCHEQGAAMCCMEMISAKAIYYNNKNTEELLEIAPEEGHVSLQLFGSDPQIMAEMAKKIEDRPFSVLDINMGCPVPKVVNNHEGSALMKDPKLVGQIVEAVAKAINKPVTVKIRRGFDEQSENAVEIAHIAEESGASAVAVHGRYRAQYYSGEANLDIIRKVKEKLSIPVLGNGDVTDIASAIRMFDATGCDGILIGRAAEGNPWVFSQVVRGLESIDKAIETEELKVIASETKDIVEQVVGQIQKPSKEEVKQMIYRHLDLLERHKGEYIAVREMRKHVAWYTAGYPHSAAIRGAINYADDKQVLVDIIEKFWK